MPNSFGGLPALIVCLVVPLLGPLLRHLSRRTPFALSLLDGFMVIAISGLVLIDILPHSFEIAGWPVVPLALAGLFIPTLLERARHRFGERAHGTALVLAVLGMLLHSAMDGAGLTFGATLSLALILHRLPVGLALWILIRKNHPRWMAWSAIALLNVATLIGYLFANQFEMHHAAPALHWFVALVAGSLLHVVVHMPSIEPKRSGGWHWASGLGALLAIALLVGLFAGPGHSHSGLESPTPPGVETAAALTVGDIFVHLALESALVLLIAYVAAGLLFGLMPIAATRWLGRGSSTWSQATRGVIFGLPIPVCSCGVVPVYRTLVQRGAPVAAALGLLIAAPELGLDSVFLSARLLGTEFTVVRCIAAAVLAIVAAALVVRGLRQEESAELPPTGEPEAEWGVRFRQGLKTGFGELVDHTGPWILLGLALAACTYPILSTQWITEIPSWAQVPMFAVLGMPVYVCASGATPLVAVLLAGGVSPGAALAFLLTGPATNVTTFGVLSALHSTRFALRFGAAVALLAVILGYAVDAVGIQVDPRVEPHGEVSSLSWIALAALCVVFAVSLLRQGPRAFVGQVLIQSDPSGDHDHGHSHGHCDH